MKMPVGTGWRRPAVRIAISGVILVSLLAFVPLHKLGLAIRSISPALWFWLLVAFLVTHVVGVIKWRLTLRLSDARLTFVQALRCYFAGLFGTVYLPSIVGGDVIRMGMAFRTGQNRAGIVLGSLVDRLLDILGLAAVAGMGAFLLPGALDPRSRKIFSVFVLMLVLAMAALFAILIVLPWRRFPLKILRLLVKLRRAGRSMLSRPYLVLVSLLLGILVQLSLVSLSALIASACGLRIPFHVWLLVWPLAKLLALLPITLGGIGIREAGLAALLAPFGAPAALTVAVGLAWESIIIGGGLCAGLVSFLAGDMFSLRSLVSSTRLRPATEELTVPPAQ
jgi:glycosyltransferase 2 family protein